MEIEDTYIDLYGEFLSSPEEIRAHNAEVAEVWDAYKRDEPFRVPATWSCMNPMRLMYANDALDFRDYWHDAGTMIQLQATASALNRRIITTDDPKRADDPVQIALDFHPFGDEAYWGCPIEFFERDQPRVHHLYEDDKVPPAQIPIPDPLRDGFMQTVCRMYDELTERVQNGARAAGLPLKPVVAADGMKITYGIFNSALQMRGTDLFLDIVEDPEYVVALLDRVATGYVHRVKTWEAKTHSRNKWYFICYDHGIDMMSMDHYRQFLVPVYERVKQAFGAEAYDPHIEHCGRGEDVIRYKHEHFGIDSFTNLNASCLDLERLRHDLGPEVYLQVTIHPGLVHTGPVEKIRQAVKEVLTPALKGAGRLTFGVQGDNFRAPLEHIKAVYEAVKEYGRY